MKNWENLQLSLNTRLAAGRDEGNEHSRALPPHPITLPPCCHSGSQMVLRYWEVHQRNKTYPLYLDLSNDFTILKNAI